MSQHEPWLRFGERPKIHEGGEGTRKRNGFPVVGEEIMMARSLGRGDSPAKNAKTGA